MSDLIWWKGMNINMDECLHENHPFPMSAMVYGPIGCSNKS